MSDVVTISRAGHGHVRVDCELSVLQEISEAFTFKVKGAEFMPAYRNRMWDGKIRLLNVMTRQILAGLYQRVVDFCLSRGYEVNVTFDATQAELSVAETKSFLESLNLPEKVKPRDYQVKAFIHAIRNKRCVLLSPTASGKSLIIYLITRYYNAKTLIIVPTISLVHQLAGDFEDYGYCGQERVGSDGSDIGDLVGSSDGRDSDEGRGWTRGIHKIFAGQERETEAQVVVTTWQTAVKLPKEWFRQFQVVIGDEAHTFHSKSLATVMGKLDHCEYRIGTTGTLDGAVNHEWTIEGMFGKTHRVISTSELMEQKHVSDLKIKCIVLSHSDEDRKFLRDKTYQEEMDFLVSCAPRNRFIKNLAISLEGNSLILFQYVEKHGKILYDMLKDEDRKVFFVHGGVEGEEREEIRHIVAKESNAIIVASYGTFSTGINIPSIANLVFASPSKSKIRNLQSIGRSLRLADGKSQATLYDLSDDLSWKSKQNYTLQHFAERIKIYNEEKFEYKLYNVKLNP